MDRTLDLYTATKNNTECILSRILCTLPHLPNHNNDVAINMSSLCPDLEVINYFLNKKLFKLIIILKFNVK